MELKTVRIPTSREKAGAFHQVTLNENVNISETKPDIGKVIRDGGEIHVEDVRVTDGHVVIRGYLSFHVLYAIGGNEKGIDNLEGRIPFEENLVVEGCKATDSARANCRLEDLSIALINSRKLDLNALMEIEAVFEQGDQLEVVRTVDDGGVQTLTAQRKILNNRYHGRDIFHFKEELALPSNKPNVAKTLLTNLQVRGIETRPLDGKIEVRGEAFLFLLYEGEDEAGRIQYLETAVSFVGEVDCPAANADMISQISARLQSGSYEVKPDTDGEMRTLAVDMTIELWINLYEEEEIELLEDIYALGRKVIPQQKKILMEEFLMKNSSRAKIADRIPMEPSTEGILQICSCEGSVNLERPEIVTNGILAEGVVNVLLMYITGDDACPVAAARANLYFHHTIEVPGITPQSRFRVEAELGQLSAAMIDNAQAEVKAVVHLNAFVCNVREERAIIDVQEKEADPAEIQRKPGIVGCIIAKGDRLWDIAKENETTVDRIVEVNHLQSPDVHEGQRILIVKEIYTKS